MSESSAENDALCDCVDWPLSGGLMHAPGCPAERPEPSPCDHESDCMFDRCGCVIVGCHGRGDPSNPPEGTGG